MTPSLTSSITATAQNPGECISGLLFMMNIRNFNLGHSEFSIPSAWLQCEAAVKCLSSSNDANDSVWHSWFYYFKMSVIENYGRFSSVAVLGTMQPQDVFALVHDKKDNLAMETAEMLPLIG